MVISIDTSRPHRRPLELLELVEAVEKALPADESSWIEWKSQLDLTTAEGAFKVARAILSFANRMPEAAAKTCGGLAYFILGAEPGNVPGTPEIDPADLDQALLKYLGSDGPLWSPHYVKHGVATVLVIVVETPAWGDPIHTLRKTFGSSEDGTVFVRSQARSKPANTAEMKMLQERLVRGASNVAELTALEVSCTVSEPGALLVVDPPPEMVDAWIQQRREALTAWHQRRVEALAEELRQKESEEKQPPSAAASLGLTVDFGSFFKHLPSVNTEGIEEHLDQCRERLLDLQGRYVVEAGWSMVTVSVLNPTARIIDDVEVTLFPDGGWLAVPEGSHAYEDELAKFPALPELRPHPMSLAGLRGGGSVLDSLSRSLSVPRLDINPHIDIDGSSITLQVGQLRPEKPREATAFTLLLHQAPDPAKTLQVAWSATSTSTHGIQRGVLQVPVYTQRMVLLEPEFGIPPVEKSP